MAGLPRGGVRHHWFGLRDHLRIASLALRAAERPRDSPAWASALGSAESVPIVELAWGASYGAPISRARRMAEHSYRTTPEDTTRMPSGVPFIIGNELAERFSFYGMKTILVVFMTQHLMGSGGVLDPMSGPQATGYYHLFSAAVYFTPFLGALLSDGVL